MGSNFWHLVHIGQQYYTGRQAGLVGFFSVIGVILFVKYFDYIRPILEFVGILPLLRRLDLITDHPSITIWRVFWFGVFLLLLFAFIILVLLVLVFMGMIMVNYSQNRKKKKRLKEEMKVDTKLEIQKDRSHHLFELANGRVLPTKHYFNRSRLPSPDGKGIHVGYNSSTNKYALFVPCPSGFVDPSAIFNTSLAHLEVKHSGPNPEDRLIDISTIVHFSQKDYRFDTFTDDIRSVFGDDYITFEEFIKSDSYQKHVQFIREGCRTKIDELLDELKGLEKNDMTKKRRRVIEERLTSLSESLTS